MIRFKVIPTCLFIIASFVFLSSDSLEAKVYKWVDEQGKSHFTDNKSKVPQKYRNPGKKKVLTENPLASEALSKNKTKPPADNCRSLPKSIDECAPFQCRQHIKMTGATVDHSIEGIKMGKCLYKQTYSKINVVMTCNLSKELRKEYADAIWYEFNEGPNSPKSDLHSLFFACKMFWSDKGSTNECSLKIATDPKYGASIQSRFKITASGDEKSFRAEALDPKTNRMLSINHHGQLKGGKAKRDVVTLVWREKCVTTKISE